MKPLAIDLFCGLGGWTEGLIAEGYRVVGFDNERHVYGDAKYPAQLVLQDVLTIHGKQFKDAALIVASPPCQEFSYMAMPWGKAKQKRAEYLNGTRDRKQLTALFDVCFRIQREASEAAGHHIPMVVDNVRGANEWVGRSRWNFGSFHLWGDVPALMPMVRHRNNGKGGRADEALGKHLGRVGDSYKGGSWFDKSKFSGPEGDSYRAVLEGTKTVGHANKRDPEGSISRTTSGKSHARKHASAQIAKIPIVLSRHIAKVYYPD
ncbi:S-adenosyl-L-methionine-dependent methyltransferase [uncultured Caudovirales phage]|uniref:S-adenosyl-L-methionine-dependent methyltransferase n=1 Tax=uncultured Caudovirales phage TaxID=2100421 RepID=A0A6J5MKW1_9CAUD|nr:S-adenosyl-L-methionine-dependent methyltransferase [uncultured Caudovirales phage]